MDIRTKNENISYWWCGYKGSVLIPELLNSGHVISYDTKWFGDNLKHHENLENIKGDIRDTKEFLEDVEAIIHLANIANDPSVDLNLH